MKLYILVKPNDPIVENTQTNRYELDKRREELRTFIVSCREHSARSTGEIREANLSHMNAAIKSLQELNRKN